MARSRPLSAALRNFGPVGVCFVLLWAASWLPPDRSAAEADAVGRLTVCLPVDRPPFVTDDPERPGFEVEILREVAARNGWTLAPHANPAIGRDFNPRDWRVTRAQCAVIAGAVALTPATRGFLDGGSPHLLSGWAAVSRGATLEEGARAGFVDGLNGADRVALGRHLRRLGVKPRIFGSPEALRAALEGGEIDVAILDSLAAQRAFEGADAAIDRLPGELGRIPIGFAYWKGDATLRRRVEAAIQAMRSDGALERIAAAYGISRSALCGSAASAC